MWFLPLNLVVHDSQELSPTPPVFCLSSSVGHTLELWSVFVLTNHPGGMRHLISALCHVSIPIRAIQLPRYRHFCFSFRLYHPAFYHGCLRPGNYLANI